MHTFAEKVSLRDDIRQPWKDFSFEKSISFRITPEDDDK